jgi:hypothetical protein
LRVEGFVTDMRASSIHAVARDLLHARPRAVNFFTQPRAKEFRLAFCIRFAMRFSIEFIAETGLIFFLLVRRFFLDIDLA